MCGIVGYIGSRQSTDVLLDGLSKLEYRGYDSAGVALCVNDEIRVVKAQGRLAVLAEKLNGMPPMASHCGIGHTRWATHGAPSDVNSHPHCAARVSLVHNGIIENYAQLKEHLMKRGYEFCSETDTEVLVKLLDHNYHGEPLDAILRTLEQVRGSYGLAILFKDFPGQIFSVRKESPLIVGYGAGENFLASDIPALLRYTRDYAVLEEGEIAVLSADKIDVYDAFGHPVQKQHLTADWDIGAAEKGGYPHFMLKEIHEQPKGIQETLVRRLNEDGTINLDGISMTKEDIENFDKVYIVACGTAYHAGLVGKLVIEKMARVPVEVDIASEFRYRDPFVDEKTLFIAISQSGETLDTLAALREAKRKGARILSVVNVVGSSVARESDDVFYTWAGPEIAVASTKAYTTQLICMYLIGLYMGSTKGTIEKDYYTQVLEELKLLPEKVEKLFGEEDQIAALARKYHRKDQVFYVGRGLDSGVSYEGSLKLKEISYINSFAIAAGELKHGTIALMEEETLVFALATQDFLYEKMVSNVEEIKARGARVVAIAKEGRTEIEQVADEVIYIPPCMDEVSPVLAVIPLQIFAYYVAKERGCNIDKPKNLAKSVTVE